MNNKIGIITFCLLCATCVVGEKSTQESFTIQPRPKKESHATINEANGRLILTNNKKCAQLIKYIADFEEFLIDEGDILLSQQKNSFFVAADSNQVQEYRSTQQELTKALDSCYTLLHQVKTKLRDVTSTAVKNNNGMAGKNIKNC